MGIPSYFLQIVKSYKNIIKNIVGLNGSVDNFYADSNGIIYDAARDISFLNKSVEVYEAEVITLVCEKIQHYIDIFQPKEKIIIAFDGVAPVAKLNQQRERRYKSWLTGDLQKRIENKMATNKMATNKMTTNKTMSNVETSAFWNTSSITPGTAFMRKLNERVTAHFESNPKVFVSTSSACGEGEHKIFQYIRDFPDLHKNQTTIIYGLDADLIMLCLNHLHVSERIFLYRETPEFIKSVDKTLDEAAQYYIDIPELAQSIIKYMNGMHDQHGQVSEKIEFQSEKCRMFDYIFICFMLGNDFMPHFPALNIRTGGIDTLLDAYRKTIGSSPGEYIICFNESSLEYKINWTNYKRYIEYLADNEDGLVRKEYKRRDRLQQTQTLHSGQQPNNKNRVSDINDIVSEWNNEELPLSMEEFNMCPVKYREKEKQINPFTEGWEHRYYSTLFHMKITASLCKKVCMNYLEGMEWTFKYYSTGCIDWRWSYNYHYPPLLKDLLQFIPDANCHDFLKVVEPQPIRDVVQLCYVLPRPSLQLLPPRIADKLLNHPNFSSMYATNHHMNWSFCKFFWECHTEMPELDLNELEAICFD
jgi:5'-3' exonuclease